MISECDVGNGVSSQRSPLPSWSKSCWSGLNAPTQLSVESSTPSPSESTTSAFIGANADALGSANAAKAAQKSTSASSSRSNRRSSFRKAKPCCHEGGTETRARLGRGNLSDLRLDAQVAAPEDEQRRDDRRHRDAERDPERERGSRRERVGAGVAAAQLGVRAARGNRRQDRESERTADLLRRVDQPGGEPGITPGHAGERRDRDRHEGESEPDAEHDEARQQVADVRAVGRDLREVEKAAAGQA